MNQPTDSAPLIGQFGKGPAQNAPRVARKETPPEVEKTDDEKIKESMDVIADEIVAKPKTPEETAESYEEGLSKVGLTLGQAREIMERVLTDNYYEKQFFIGSLPVTLRTRTYHDTVRLHRFLTSESPTYQASIQDLIARHNLAAALARFGDNVFEFPEDAKKAEEAFDTRHKFVESRNEFVVTKLMKLSYEFDTLLAKVFADGAPQDF